MDTVTLGRTGLVTTAAGLGCGGFSRIGIGKGLDHAASVVRAAYEAGVRFFDTAHAYGTEEAVGLGLQGIPRDSYILSTKYMYRGENIYPAGRLREDLEDSLRKLKTGYVDVCHIHALRAEDIAWAQENLLPVLLEEKQKGKIRFLAVSEHFNSDTSHRMLRAALPLGLFDVIMVGYNILNPSAAETVLPLAVEQDLGVLCMFAVRQALHDKGALVKTIEKILERGQGGEGLTADEGILDFLTDSGIASNLTEAAYRFCRHTKGISVTLTGTGNEEHLRENLRSLEKPPLPDSVLVKLYALFGNVDCVSGQVGRPDP